MPTRYPKGQSSFTPDQIGMVAELYRQRVKIKDIAAKVERPIGTILGLTYRLREEIGYRNEIYKPHSRAMEIAVNAGLCEDFPIKRQQKRRQ